MNTEDNVVELTQEEYDSAMTELLAHVDQEQLGRTVAGVLEFLTVRAIIDGPFYLMTDDEQAITVIAANDDAAALRAALPDNFKSWDEYVEETVDYITDRDPGDEQDEPASEQE
jgi:hypothetical protein